MTSTGDVLFVAASYGESFNPAVYRLGVTGEPETLYAGNPVYEVAAAGDEMVITGRGDGPDGRGFAVLPIDDYDQPRLVASNDLSMAARGDVLVAMHTRDSETAVTSLGEHPWEVLLPGMSPATGAAVCPGRGVFVKGSRDTTAYLLDEVTGEILDTIPVTPPEEEAGTIVLGCSPNSESVLLSWGASDDPHYGLILVTLATHDVAVSPEPPAGYVWSATWVQ